MGLVKPVKGVIKYNSKTINNLSAEIINLASYLPQDPIILEGSIKLNITLENNENYINREKLKSSIEISNVKEFINNYDNGIDTKIGENGIRLSGGQNRRIALARAFYHGSNIIILDEATSSLDVKNENEILEEIKKLKGKITIIVISHQKTALKYCDKIYKVFDHKLLIEK